MKTDVRTFHVRIFLLPSVCLLLLLAEASWADDKTAPSGSSAPASSQAPDLNTYTPPPSSASSDPALDSSTLSGSTDMPNTAARPKADPDQQKAEEKEQNWLFNNIADQQKADRDRARAAQGLPPEKDADKDKSDPASLLLYPAVSLTPPNPKDAAKTDKDGKPVATTDAKTGADSKSSKDGTPNLPLAKSSNQPLDGNAIAKPNSDSMNQFQPMIKGLSLDTSKPLADSSLPLADPAKKITVAPAPSSFDDAKITPINPDLVKPIDFSSNGSSSDTAANASGPIMIAPGGAPDDTKVPAFDIPSATATPTFNSSYTSAITAPSAPSMPMPPSVTSITAITSIDNPSSPAMPNPVQAPSYHPAPAYQSIPTAGPSKPKVNDPLDMTFVH